LPHRIPTNFVKELDDMAVKPNPGGMVANMTSKTLNCFYLEQLVVNRNKSTLLLHVVVGFPQDGNLLVG
jgi:hypothetical protein